MKKGSFSTFLLILVLLAGLSLLLYPTFSDYWNSMHQTQAIAKYSEDVSKLEKVDYSAIWSDAIAYNQKLALLDDPLVRSTDLDEAYPTLLNLGGSGIMGYIDIPSIGVSLPIYHGTEENVLQVAVGHITWSSLPTGGENTHCLLSAHRGLPSAKLFTDLDQLRERDFFTLRILNELLTYEIDQILIVEPHDIAALHIEEGKDLCTLITCTPYGVNTHRLLVRGHRVENNEQTEAVRVLADAIEVDPIVVAAIIVGPILIVLLIITSLFDRSKRKRH